MNIYPFERILALRSNEQNFTDFANFVGNCHTLRTSIHSLLQDNVCLPPRRADCVGSRFRRSTFNESISRSFKPTCSPTGDKRSLLSASFNRESLRAANAGAVFALLLEERAIASLGDTRKILRNSPRVAVSAPRYSRKRDRVFISSQSPFIIAEICSIARNSNHAVSKTLIANKCAHDLPARETN